MTERAAPFYCPYCGDEDLRPSEEGPSAWECAACNRAFSLRFLGLLARGLPREAGHERGEGDGRSDGDGNGNDGGRSAGSEDSQEGEPTP